MTRVEKAEHFLPMQCRLGEGSRWNAGEQRLYWLDIENGLFYRYDVARKDDGAQPEKFDVGLPVGVLAFREKGGLVMATRDGFATWDFASQALTSIADP